LRHVAECIVRLLKRKDFAGQRLQFTSLESIHEHSDRLMHQIAARFNLARQVYRGVRDIGPDGFYGFGGAKVGHSKLNESATRREGPQARIDEWADERIQDDVDTATCRSFVQLCCKVERSRIHHCADADGSEIAALFFASRGCEDNCSSSLRDLNCCKTHSAGPGVNQYAFTGLKPRHLTQAVFGGEKGDGDCDGCCEIELLRFVPRELRLGGRESSKASTAQRENLVAWLEANDAWTKPRDNSGALSTDGARLALVHAKHVQNIPEVQSGSAYFNFNFTGLWCSSFRGKQLQTLNRASPGKRQLHVGMRRCRAVALSSRLV
jgi:hypothetical protein